jgi:hypothetical protein
MGLLEELSADANKWRKRELETWDASRSVMPEVRQSAARDIWQDWAPVTGLLGTMRLRFPNPVSNLKNAGLDDLTASRSPSALTKHLQERELALTQELATMPKGSPDLPLIKRDLSLVQEQLDKFFGATPQRYEHFK